MDNHHFPNTIHVFIADHPDNDADNEDLPELVPLDALRSHATEPQQQATADVEMNGEDSDMSSLASLSDSSGERDHNNDSESEDAREVEIQTVNDHRLNEHAVADPSPTSHTPQDQPAVNNRRARVEEDEDEDRDRRHPSQRIGSSANTASSAGPSSSTPILAPSQIPTAAPQPMPGVRIRGQAPIFNRTVVDEATTARAHPFRFFQHLMSNNNNNNDTGNANPVPSGGPMPAPQPRQDGNTPDNQRPVIEGFSVTLDIGLGTPFHMGGGAHPPDGEPNPNAADPNINANPNAQNGLPTNASFVDFMARFGLLGQAVGLGENGPEGTIGATAPAGNNSDQGATGATPGAQFGFNFPAGGFNFGNLAGLFNLDGSAFGDKEDPERARKLVDGLEEVPVGLVRRLERVGGTGGGMGEDETKGGDGGCAICWDRLLGGSTAEEDVHRHEEGGKKEEEGERTQPKAPADSNAASNSNTAKIVSLPCAHVFHAECLIPWFSRPRQTTCPTCRFNIDPENLTYVSWRRRMRERRERERADARAGGNPQNAEGNGLGQDGIAPPAHAVAAQPAIAPLPDAPSDISEHVLSFLSSLEAPPLVPAHSQTPDASPLDVHPRPTAQSQSQPPSTQATSSSSVLTPVPSTSQPSIQTPPAANNWDAMPGLQDMSDSEDEDDNEEDDDENQDDDEEDDDDDDEDEDEDEDEDGNGAQEQGNGQGIQAPPVLPHTTGTPIASTPSTQAEAQAPRQRRNDFLGPRTIQTTHGLVTFIPVPFNFPFPSAGNGVGVGVQAGGNGANVNVPPAAGRGQFANANVYTQGLPHFHAQRAPQGAAPPATPAPANRNSIQPTFANPLVSAQEADNEEQLIQHLLSHGLTADEAETIRRSTAAGRQADRLRRGEDSVEEDEYEENAMMDIDEGMGMVVDLTMEQGGAGGINAGPAAIAAQDERDFAHAMNFFNHAARQQTRAGTQTQGQAQQQERGPAAGAQGAQGDAPQQPPPNQPPQPQRQGQGFAPFMAGWNAGFNIGNHVGNFGPEDGRAMNEFVAEMFTNLMGVPPRQQARGQDGQPQPQPQPQPQAAQEPTEGPNANNNTNNGGRPRQTQFAFGNVTIGPFTSIGSLLDQIPILNPNSAANTNGGQDRVKKAWTLPPAPGPTLRQRIERRERDAGLRCYDISCGVGPSDEDPVISDETIAGLPQLMIMNKNHGSDRKAGVCTHTFHAGCLVSAERVALGGADVSVVEGGDVEVACPVCRSAGCVTKTEWDEGVLALT